MQTVEFGIIQTLTKSNVHIHRQVVGYIYVWNLVIKTCLANNIYVKTN